MKIASRDSPLLSVENIDGRGCESSYKYLSEADGFAFNKTDQLGISLVEAASLSHDPKSTRRPTTSR